MSSIQTTHVGSLPRSKELSEFLFAKDRGENFNQSNFDNILKDNVEKVVINSRDTFSVPKDSARSIQQISENDGSLFIIRQTN